MSGLAGVLAQQETAISDARISQLSECKFLSEQEVIELAAKCKVGGCTGVGCATVAGMQSCRRNSCHDTARWHTMAFLVLHTTTTSCERSPWQRKAGGMLAWCASASTLTLHAHQGPAQTCRRVAPQELLARENNVTHVRAPVVVVGDTHGQVCWLGRQAAVLVAQGPLVVLEQPPSCNSCSVPSPQVPYEQHDSACMQACCGLDNHQHSTPATPHLLSCSATLSCTHSSMT